MIEESETRYCFRCRNMAVIDMGHLRLLPMVMDRARHLLLKGKFESQEETEDAWHTQDSLAIYKNILESVTIDREN